MKKKLILFITYLALLNSAFSQNYNWITPDKPYLKLYVIDDAIYRISKSDFTSAGVNADNINPRTVKVYYKGSEIPVYFQGENDGVFNDADYFDFYGKRNYGGPTPRRNSFTNDIAYTVDEYYNLYSDTNVYWVGWDGSNGIRMQQSSIVSSINFPENFYYKKAHFERDLFYDLGETVNSASDYRYFSNEIVVGEGWYWKKLEVSERVLSDTVFINDLSSSPQLCSLHVFIKPISFSDSVLNEHRVEVKINNNLVGLLISNNLRKIDTTITFSSSLLINNSINNLSFSYDPVEAPNYSPKVYFDFGTLTYPSDFTIRNNLKSLRFNGSDTVSKKITLAGYTPGNQTNIYDINNNIRIEGFSGSGNSLTFTGRSNSSFEIVNNVISKKPMRIVRRQVPDLVNSNNGADYLVVYHKLFESQAEQLRNHRQTFDSFRSFKAEIQDIYDIFNYGIEDPDALRNFIKHAYQNWSQPGLKYICLFGRASLDPKKSNPSSTYTQNFVPTYGHPSTDGYFANINFGTFTYYHQISIGRVPVYTTTEAQNAVDKIIGYDQQPPDKWWKKYIAITGGGYRAEQLNFQFKSDNLINNYIQASPPCMPFSRIYRNDSSGYITYNYRDSIKREFDRGAILVNFIGHAAAEDWEIGLENPNTLTNGPKQPLVLSFTCYTGKNAEPNLRSFGENFFLLPNKCAIGFVGTTGWSFSGSGDSFNDFMLRSFSYDSLRRIGDLVSYASKRISADSASFPVRNTINCYNLIGDPATRLHISNTPEFDIKPNEYSFANALPAVGELIKLSIFPKNLGTTADSLRIRFLLRKDGAPHQSRDTLINDFCFTDTVKYFFSIDTIGNYSMSVILDPNRDYDQRIYANDSISVPIALRNLSYVQLKPLDNASLNSPRFTFAGLNPNVKISGGNVRNVLQVDTSRFFDSPVLQTYHNSNPSGVTDTFSVNLPVQVLNTVYFIRTNSIVNGDSSGWSELKKVIYNPEVSLSDKTPDSAYTIYTIKPEQYSEPDIVDVNFNGSGFVLNSFEGSLQIRSFGSNGPEASFFIIGDFQYYSDAGANIGLNIAKVKRLTGEVLDVRNYRMNSGASSDSVLNFLNTFDSTEFIMTYLASWVPDFDSLRQNAKNKFKEFGSVLADSVRHQHPEDLFDTWAFLGYLGADTTQTCEKFHRFRSDFSQVPLNCISNPEFLKTSGKISHSYGIADRWKNFSWEQELQPNSSIVFDVFGIQREDNSSVLLYSDLSQNNLVNLDTVDFYRYPQIRLDAKLSIDTSLGSQSPELKSVSLRYYPPSELLPDNYSFTGSDTSVQEGDSVSFSVNYYNVGYIDVPEYYYKWYVKQKSGDYILKQDTVNEPLLINAMKTSAVSFSTAGLRDPKIASDTLDLYFTISLTGERNELFSYNNTAITKFSVQGDTLNPVMDVTYDGVKILNGDFVKSKPNIELSFFDNSRLEFRDTSNIKVYITKNNIFKYVPYYINGMKNPEIDIVFPENNFLQATVIYRPSLDTGETKLRYVANDITGNYADSIVNTVYVKSDLGIYEMANYPNPMKTQTSFMFKLSGELNPTSCKVRIYSVAGRLIKEINAPAVIGYNNISWDGLDNDGDYIANGTYLYKFIIQGNSQVETSIQKLVVLR